MMPESHTEGHELARERRRVAASSKKWLMVKEENVIVTNPEFELEHSALTFQLDCLRHSLEVLMLTFVSLIGLHPVEHCASKH